MAGDNFCAHHAGASILALTARQVGKTTTAAWAIAHFMRFYCRVPVRDRLSGATAKCGSGAAACANGPHKAGAELESDNVYALELKNGSRVLALPGSEDSIRGLTVDGWIVADEAARLTRCSDRRVAPDAGPPPAGAVCHVVDGMEPHRSILDGLGGR